MDLYYLIYTSRPVKVMGNYELEKLLVNARKENQVHQITGMLVCIPGMFVQLIEGPEKDIDQLYQNIQNDTRHYNVTRLKEGHIQKRFFPDWTMGFDTQSTSSVNSDGSFHFTDTEVLSLFNILDEGIR